jgi:hypothetical protein
MAVHDPQCPLEDAKHCPRVGGPLLRINAIVPRRRHVPDKVRPFAETASPPLVRSVCVSEWARAATALLPAPLQGWGAAVAPLAELL